MIYDLIYTLLLCVKPKAFNTKIVKKGLIKQCRSKFEPSHLSLHCLLTHLSRAI